MRFSMLCLTLSGVLWGTGGLLGSLLGQVAGLSPLAVAAARLLIGGGLMVACLLVTRARRPRSRQAWRRIAVNGGRGGVITQGLALASLVLLVGGPSIAGSGERALAGCGLGLLSAAGFAAITLIGSSPVPGLRDLTVNGYGFTLGGIILVPFAMAAAPGGGFGFRAGMSAAGPYETAGLLMALAVAPTAVAYTLYYRGLRGESASTAALLTLLEPLTAAILGAVLLGDRLGVAGVTGALILGAALVRAALTPGATGSARASAGGGEGEQARDAEAVAGER